MPSVIGRLKSKGLRIVSKAMYDAAEATPRCRSLKPPVCIPTFPQQEDYRTRFYVQNQVDQHRKIRPTPCH